MHTFGAASFILKSRGREGDQEQFGTNSNQKFAGEEGRLTQKVTKTSHLKIGGHVSCELLVVDCVPLRVPHIID